ncbi:hypothetical protein ACB098_11G159400 [Castanea mollissima]
MEVLSCILYLCLSLTIIQALHTIAKRSKSIPKKLPTGPKPFPIIGNLLELGNKPHKSLAKLAMTNGPLMSLKLGHITTVVISSATMAKEVLQTHDQLFSNRSIPDAIRAHKQHELGLPWIPVSSRWRNIRKICDSQLFAHKIVDANQNLRRKKVQELLADVHKSCLTNDAVDIGRAAFKTTLNLLSNTICTVDLADSNSDMAREFKELVWNIMEEVGKPNLADYFPVLRKNSFDNLINKWLLTRKVPDSIRNIDMLNTLLEISEESTGEFDKTQIERLFLDLFIAGNDTTFATLEWTMAELIHNPEVLSKAKEELNRIIGKGNPVEEFDIARLPYLQAIVKETFRLHPPVPLLLPCKAEADVEIQGFTVPKGRDSSIWENPNSFKPERFMGSEIDVKGRNFELILFGAGKRICPGLPLAIRMLHLMLEDGFKPEDMSMDDKFGLTLQMAQPLRAIPIMLPPGPKPFPIIGNLLELVGHKPQKSMAKLANTHDPLMTLKLGQKTTIVISSVDLAKEVLQQHDQFFCNRTIPESVVAGNQHEFSLPWLPVSAQWRNLRRICKSHLFANQILDANQNLRRKKVQELLADIHNSSLNGDAVDIGKVAFRTSLNLLSNTIFSVDLVDPNSAIGRELSKLVHSILEVGSHPNLADYFPVLKKVDFQGIWLQMTIYFGKMIDLFSSIISQRLLQSKTFGSIRNNDMLDTLFHISEESDLFLAGNDTTSATLEWAMAELLYNPEVLTKAKAELKKIIGKGNVVVESDIDCALYLQAIVKETFRLHPPGFIVPKGAQVLVNIWAIGRDASIWENPNSFKPERFMGSEIDVKGRNFELIPFGAGRRMCPGLPLALRMLHLMLGSLIHTFDWKVEGGFKPKDIYFEEKFGLTLQKAEPLRAIPIMV